MTDRPILFSAPMVRALLDGRKTQTRRLCAWANNPQSPALTYIVACDEPGWFGDEEGEVQFRVPFAPGDRLWVKETWQVGMSSDGPCVAYRANSDRYYPEFTGPSEGAGPTFDYDAHPAKAWRHGHWIADVEARGPWSSTLHMPRWASRLTLLVTDVRVERLQAITLGDICAEGLAASIYDFKPVQRGFDAWIALWDSINGEGAWEANPWVVAVTFEVRKGNIDV